MRRFFATIFVWFLLTVSAAGTVFLLTGIYDPEGMIGRRWEVLTGRSMTLHGVEAAEAYEREGAAGLRRSLDRLDETFTVETALYGSDGRSLLNERDLPGSAVMIRRTLRAGRGQARLLSDRAFCTHLIETETGGRYVLAITFNGAPFAHLTGPVSRGFLTLSLVFAFCYVAAVSLARPIEQLRQATRGIVAGDFSVRVGPELSGRRDELGGLARDFDAMETHVQELLTARRQLLQDVSHELRSPLARLGVALELVRSQQADSRSEFALSRMEKDLRRMDELIGEILTLARMEDGGAREVRAPVDLGALLTNIATDANFEAQQEEKQVVLNVAAVPPISADPELLRRAFENVILNALRYAPPGTRVEVAMEQIHGNAGDSISISVRDYGPGVPPEDLHTIFQPFYRVAKDRDRRSGGYGLGLAITYQAIRLHGGEIAAEPAGPGLRVRMTLPISRQGASAPRPDRSAALEGGHRRT